MEKILIKSHNLAMLDGYEFKHIKLNSLITDYNISNTHDRYKNILTMNKPLNICYDKKFCRFEYSSFKKEISVVCIVLSYGSEWCIGYCTYTKNLNQFVRRLNVSPNYLYGTNHIKACKLNSLINEYYCQKFQGYFCYKVCELESSKHIHYSIMQKFKPKWNILCTM